MSLGICKLKQQEKQGIVAHKYNSKYLRGGSRRIRSLKSFLAIWVQGQPEIRKTLSQNEKKNNEIWLHTH